jgi:hypothetical protein
MRNLIRKLFRRSRNAKYTLDPNGIKARAISYHMNHHHEPGLKLDTLRCHLEYDGGENAQIAVLVVGKQVGRLYSYSIRTDRIDDLGDLPLSRRL